MATKLNVVNLQMPHAAAELAAPAVALQNSSVQFTVALQVKLHSPMFRPRRCHESIA